MKNRPFLMALVTFGAIFILFVVFAALLGRCSGGGARFSMGEKVGVVEITGVLTSSQEINEQLVAFRDDNSIKAVVLRVDSPGGGVAPSQEIHDQIARVAKVKPVVVSMGSVAASGGYYVSLPAARILANPGTITGSIGVIMEVTNIEELFRKVGLKSQVVKSGEHKDIGSPLRGMSDSDRRILQGVIDDVYEQFVDAVAEARQMAPAKVKVLADGRIFTGRQAVTVGLVDELGSLYDAANVAGQLAGIKGEPKLVYPPKKKARLVDYLVSETLHNLRRGLGSEKAGGAQFLWSE
jgi:protease IV